MAYLISEERNYWLSRHLAIYNRLTYRSALRWRSSQQLFAALLP
jgi:hypothetical protein